ncbi:MAG: UvrD-helicase domain-containing protein [Polyangiales bacterium]
MTKRGSVADAKEREKAIRERTRNVVVDAGAGTGKTTLLIARLLHLIAPDDDGPALQLERIAAITFTRKAAGELKLRLREALLEHAAHPSGSALRRERLATALESLDHASISTVHSFADRLLRLRPADAQLSPAYEIAEDPSELIDETFNWLLASAQQVGASGLPDEAVETLRIFQLAGLRVRTRELEFGALLGLDAFVRDVIELRDREVESPARLAPDFAQVRRGIAELRDLVSELTLDSYGNGRLRRLAADSERIAQPDDFAESLRRAVDWSRELRSAEKELRLKEHFDGDTAGWGALKWLVAGQRGHHKTKEEREGGPLGRALVAPLMASMAARLVRLRPLIIARYAQVKRAHGVVDQIDLLVELRDLLQRSLTARAFYQARFDHLMVDEFQDTDPLQAEIVLYLCESGARAKRRADIVLTPGKLTIVGDPKQSIYRFRRADIAMYAEVCAQLRAAKVCEASLTVNFRSTPSILSWVNDAFDAVLGVAAEGRPLFDREAGTVCNVRLHPGVAASGGPGVHVLPFGDDELSADDSRDVEGEALAHYLRYLVEDSTLTILDPATRERRRPRYGDIAVMMIATQTVHHLTTELDRIGVPHVVRGGTLFMQDPLHQQLVLGLCALADPSDGVARAALLRPPFFAVSLEDLLRARVHEDKSPPLLAAEVLIAELRLLRHQLPPGETARRVVERTGFGRYVAASVNGAQRLARLYELCMRWDELARASQLDFDAVAAIARGFIDSPPRIDAPLPVDADAVQVITTHQAKGLEWPIVALWDGRASWRAFLPQVAWKVDAVSGSWALELDGLSYDPSDRQLQDRERGLREKERRRVAYVAATRARELLIIPRAGTPSTSTIAGALLLGAAGQTHHAVPAYRSDAPGWWQSASGVSMRPSAPARRDLREAWSRARERAFEPRLVPAGVTSVAHARDVEADGGDERPPRDPLPREGRFGPLFGSTVHRALQLLLTRPLEPDAASRRAANETALPEHREQVLADVQRTHATLSAAGLLGFPRQLEYPIAGSLEPTSLLTGYLDLLIAMPQALCIIDFKTDAAPRGDVERLYPGYVEQVRTYRRLLESSTFTQGRDVRAALLFTADGTLHWV